MHTRDISGDFLVRAGRHISLELYGEDDLFYEDGDFSELDITKVERVNNPSELLLDDEEGFGCRKREVLWEQLSIQDYYDYTKGEITPDRAASFYIDLCEKVYGKPGEKCGGIMCVDMIAEHMGVSVERANEFCNEMIRDGITELQSGLIVV